MSGQNVPAWLYGQAGTFCPNKMSHDKTSPFGNIGKRRHFVRGHFVLGIFCLGDILSWGRFVLWTFCLVDILSWGRFVLGTFCPWGHFVRGRFVLGTFCLGDNLSWGQSVKGTFCLGTLCPQGHFLHGDILYMGTFCPVTYKTGPIFGRIFCCLQVQKTWHGPQHRSSVFAKWPLPANRRCRPTTPRPSHRRHCA